MKLNLNTGSGDLLNTLDDLVEARLGSVEFFVEKFIQIKQRELNNLKNMKPEEVYEYIKKSAKKVRIDCPSCGGIIEG